MGSNEKKIASVLQLSDHEKYGYFIRKVADFEEVWGLYNDGWALLGNDRGSALLPFWPEREFAELCAVDQWAGYSPKAIDLDDFIQKWLPGMEKDGKHASIFYSAFSKGLVAAPSDLADDLEDELSR